MRLDANEIVPNLWQGSVPPKGEALQNKGFAVLVLCAREFQYQANLFPGIKVIHASNDDHGSLPLTREKLRVAIQAARQVVDALKAGQKVLVTCHAGLNRSGLVSALALHLFYGWSGAKCIALIRLRRHSRVRPDLAPLSNRDFVRALLRLEAHDGPAHSALQADGSF